MSIRKEKDFKKISEFQSFQILSWDRKWNKTMTYQCRQRRSKHENRNTITNQTKIVFLIRELWFIWNKCKYQCHKNNWCTNWLQILFLEMRFVIWRSWKQIIEISKIIYNFKVNVKTFNMKISFHYISEEKSSSRSRNDVLWKKTTTKQISFPGNGSWQL